MAAAPVVIAAMEPAQSALTSRKSWPKIRCCSPSQDLEAVEGKERQNRANITNSVCYHLSFTQCLCLEYRVSMSASLDRTSSTVPDEECSRMLQD